jgi:hypothetical protein
MELIGKLGRKIILSDNQVEIRVGGFMDKLFGKPSVVFFYSQIQSIELKNNRGLADATITFIISGNEAYRGSQKAFAIGDKNPYCFFLKRDQQNEANEIRKECLKRIELINKKPSISNNSLDISDQLEKLSNLKEKGVITEEEFNKKKEELLTRI